MELLGEKLLPQNDPKIFRSGGRPFVYKGRSYRVCQDCRTGYGKALYFRSDDHELHLTPHDLNYTKQILLDGMHTYSATEGFEVIDLKTRRLNPLNLAMRIIGKLYR